MSKCTVSMFWCLFWLVNWIHVWLTYGFVTLVISRLLRTRGKNFFSKRHNKHCSLQCLHCICNHSRLNVAFPYRKIFYCMFSIVLLSEPKSCIKLKNHKRGCSMCRSNKIWLHITQRHIKLWQSRREVCTVN